MEGQLEEVVSQPVNMLPEASQVSPSHYLLQEGIGAATQQCQGFL